MSPRFFEFGMFGWQNIIFDQAKKNRVEAYLVRGSIKEDETAELHPLLQKKVLQSFIENVEPGPYELELWDRENNLLLKRSFDAKDAQDGNGRIRLIQEAVPYKEGLQKIVIKYGDSILIERDASLYFHHLFKSF